MFTDDFKNKLLDLSFKWEDLHGKTLTIFVAESIDGTVVVGKDVDGVVYVLDMKIKRELI